MKLTEYHLDILRECVSDDAGYALFINATLLREVLELKREGYLRRWRNEDSILTLTEKGCAEIGAACKDCGGLDRVSVVPTDSMARFTFCCHHCIEQWKAKISQYRPVIAAWPADPLIAPSGAAPVDIFERARRWFGR